MALALGSEDALAAAPARRGTTVPAYAARASRRSTSRSPARPTCPSAPWPPVTPCSA